MAPSKQAPHPRRNHHGDRARRARRPPAGWRPLMALRSDRLDAIVSLSKRRGFVYPSSEIYGGLRAAWDYGPLGVELKNNIKRQWWRTMVTGARRHRRPRFVRDPRPGGLGGERARHRVRRPADRVPVLPQAVPRRSADRGLRGQARPRPGRRPGRDQLPELRHQGRLHRAAHVQRPAAHLPRPGRRRVRAGLPAPGDRAGHLHQLPQRAADLSPQDPVRHRPDRQVVPQRDHPGQLHLPHPRVRADGDGVLRPPGHRRGMAPVLDRRALPLVPRPRHPPGEPAALRAPQGKAVALLQAHGGHRVQVRLRGQRVGRTGGHRQPHRLTT